MSNCYRYLNHSEKKKLWSILLCQMTIILLSWYDLEIIQRRSGCVEVLRKNYSFASLYIEIPHQCTQFTGFWLRINSYTMYSVMLLFSCVSVYYTVSAWHLFLSMFTWTGLVWNAFRAQSHHSLIYRDAPFFVLVSYMLLYLEKKPFHDLKMVQQCLDIRDENNDRQLELDRLNDECRIVAFDRIEQCDNKLDQNEILRHMDEQLEENRLKYPLLELPGQLPLEEKKQNIFFDIFLFVTFSLLFSLALWNYLLFLYNFGTLWFQLLEREQKFCLIDSPRSSVRASARPISNRITADRISFPTWLSMGISNPRSGLSMPIGSSYRLIGVTFSDGSTTRRWAFSMGLLIATREITEFYFDGSRLNQLEKRVTWGRLGRRVLDTHRRYMQNRVKIRFEHMYLRLWNFHRGVDLNILTPLTMQTRIVIIGKIHFDDDRQFFLLILNSISTGENKSVRF